MLLPIAMLLIALNFDLTCVHGILKNKFTRTQPQELREYRAGRGAGLAIGEPADRIPSRPSRPQKLVSTRPTRVCTGVLVQPWVTGQVCQVAVITPVTAMAW